MKMIAISDAAYAQLLRYAQAQQEDPSIMLEHIIATLHPPLETDDWFRHLGMTEEEIALAHQRASEDDDADS
jgi:hypothetical protein